MLTKLYVQNMGQVQQCTSCDKSFLDAVNPWLPVESDIWEEFRATVFKKSSHSPSKSKT